VSLWAGHSSVKVTMDHYMHMQEDAHVDGLAVLN
jgi:hypothetical protein